MKLTPDDINRAIKRAEYHLFPGTTTTVCCLVLHDGFTVVGKSACIDIAEFDEALGRSYAHENAVDQVWAFEGRLARYLLSRDEVNLIHSSEQFDVAVTVAPTPEQIAEIRAQVLAELQAQSPVILAPAQLNLQPGDLQPGGVLSLPASDAQPVVVHAAAATEAAAEVAAPAPAAKRRAAADKPEA